MDESRFEPRRVSAPIGGYRLLRRNCTSAGRPSCDICWLPGAADTPENSSTPSSRAASSSVVPVSICVAMLSPPFSSLELSCVVRACPTAPTQRGSVWRTLRGGDETRAMAAGLQPLRFRADDCEREPWPTPRGHPPDTTGRTPYDNAMERRAHALPTPTHDVRPPGHRRRRAAGMAWPGADSRPPAALRTRPIADVDAT